MTLRHLAIILLGCAASAAGAAGAAPTPWIEGRNFVELRPPHPPDVMPGKMSVVEVFSYACPACNAFYPTVDKLRVALPANTQLDFVPASFIPTEDWPMFQRAFYTAQALGVDARTHDAMFDAIWKTGELATIDPATHELKQHMPTIEDAAKFYARVAGVKPEAFVAAANSFAVNVKIQRAEELMRAWKIDQTPTIIVNGKYQLTPATAGGYTQTIELVKWLLSKDSGAKPAS